MRPHTRINSRERYKPVRLGATILTYLLVTAIVLLPIRFHFFQVFVPLLLAVIGCSVLGDLIIRGARLPYSPVYVSLGIFTAIYALWSLLALYYGNHLNYLFEDSAGFLVYLIFPLFYTYLFRRQMANELTDAIIFAAMVVAIIHIAVFAAYHLVFGGVSFVSLAAVNSLLDSLGFTWELGASGGVLRANTKCGHFLLLGIGLLYFRFLHTKQPVCLMLIGVLLVGAMLDGHKALIVAIAIFILFVLPLVFRTFELYPLKWLGPACIIAGVVLLAFALFIDAESWMERFTALESDSVTVRIAQIGALLDEIAEKPFLGHGFGAQAAIIRNEGRPFMYEVDFLAVTMKLGLLGALAYFSTYVATVALVIFRRRNAYGYVILAIGLAYLFYMGANGGFAMSPISSFFHILLFSLVSFGLQSAPVVGRMASSARCDAGRM